MLKQFLGENTDNYSMDLSKRNRYVGSLIRIAGWTKKFTSVEAADMWVQDAGSPYYSDAKAALAVLDIMVKNFKKYHTRVR